MEDRDRESGSGSSEKIGIGLKIRESSQPYRDIQYLDKDPPKVGVEEAGPGAVLGPIKARKVVQTPKLSEGPLSAATPSATVSQPPPVLEQEPVGVPEPVLGLVPERMDVEAGPLPIPQDEDYWNPAEDDGEWLDHPPPTEGPEVPLASPPEEEVLPMEMAEVMPPPPPVHNVPSPVSPAVAAVVAQPQDPNRPSRKRFRPSKKLKGRTCPICDTPVPTSKGKRHFQRWHAPFFFNPADVCWECDVRLEGNELRVHQQQHPAGVFREEHYERCARLFFGLLECLRRSCRCNSLGELLQCVVTQELIESNYSPGLEQRRSPTQLDLFSTVVPGMADQLGISADVEFFPPSNVLALLHWRHLSALLANGDDTFRMEVRTCRIEALASGEVVADPLNESFDSAASEVCVVGQGTTQSDLFLMDAHLHLDWLLEKTRRPVSQLCSALLKLNDDPKLEKTEFPVQSVVSNCVCPWLWDHAPSILDHAPYDVNYTFGIHPHFADQYRGKRVQLEDLMLDGRCVGVGETGFDIQCHHGDEYHCAPGRDHPEQFFVQEECFRAQVRLAQSYRKTLVLHLRDKGHQAVSYIALQILKELKATDLPVHYHCFVGTKRLADEWVASVPNVKFGFTAHHLRLSGKVKKTCSGLMLDRIVPETDAPFLYPFEDQQPKKGTKSKKKRKTNPPDALHLAVRAIAELKGMEVARVVPELNSNIRSLYGL